MLERISFDLHNEVFFSLSPNLVWSLMHLFLLVISLWLKILLLYILVLFCQMSGWSLVIHKSL